MQLTAIAHPQLLELVSAELDQGRDPFDGSEQGIAPPSPHGSARARPNAHTCANTQSLLVLACQRSACELLTVPLTPEQQGHPGDISWCRTLKTTIDVP